MKPQLRTVADIKSLNDYPYWAFVPCDGNVNIRESKKLKRKEDGSIATDNYNYEWCGYQFNMTTDMMSNCRVFPCELREDFSVRPIPWIREDHEEMIPCFDDYNPRMWEIRLWEGNWTLIDILDGEEAQDKISVNEKPGYWPVPRKAPADSTFDHVWVWEKRE